VSTTSSKKPRAQPESQDGTGSANSTQAERSGTQRIRTKKPRTAAEPPQDPAHNTTPPSEPSLLWRRLVAAVRGGVSEIGEAIAESQALRILDQEIRDNDAELHRVRTSLAETLARYKVAQDKLAALTRKSEEYEGYAIKALQSGEQALARELAAKIALLEIEADGETVRVHELSEGVTHLRKVVAQYETTIKRLKKQVDTVRATESVQRAQAAVAGRQQASDTRVRTALDSLERIKRKQIERGARLRANEDAMATDEDEALQAKLRRAGIIGGDDRAASVLSRLQQKHEGQS
jgi:phage shock protein A